MSDTNNISYSRLPVSKSIENSLVDLLCDKMTQCRYEQPIESFDLSVITDDVYEVDILTEGKAALEKANKILGIVQFKKSRYWAIMHALSHLFGLMGRA